MERHRIHTHPIMEKNLKVPEGHVIIDEELYQAILFKYGIFFEETNGVGDTTIHDPKRKTI